MLEALEYGPPPSGSSALSADTTRPELIRGNVWTSCFVFVSLSANCQNVSIVGRSNSKEMLGQTDHCQSFISFALHVLYTRQINTFRYLPWQSKPCASCCCSAGATGTESSPAAVPALTLLALLQRDIWQHFSQDQYSLCHRCPHQHRCPHFKKPQPQATTFSLPQGLPRDRVAALRTWLWHLSCCRGTCSFPQSLLQELIPFGWGHYEAVYSPGKDLGCELAHQAYRPKYGTHQGAGRGNGCLYWDSNLWF